MAISTLFFTVSVLASASAGETGSGYSWVYGRMGQSCTSACGRLRCHSAGFQDCSSQTFFETNVTGATLPACNGFKTPHAADKLVVPSQCTSRVWCKKQWSLNVCEWGEEHAVASGNCDAKEGSHSRFCPCSCPAGTFGMGTSAPCQGCPAGQYQNSAALSGNPGSITSSCQGCAVGQYQDSTGEASCKACTAGRSEATCLGLAESTQPGDLADETCPQLDMMQLNIPSETIPVFYNLFVNSEKDIPRVRLLVDEQLALARPEHRVFVHSIKTPMPISNTTLLEHHLAGNEEVTLHSLWQHCRGHPEDKVVYLHSKGSFHNNADNDMLRRFLTRGALSKECSALPPTCNVCSSRMSPIPHPHTSGNMWLARCEYVAKLMNPFTFSAAMGKHAPRATPSMRDSCRGVGRFAAEHWIHSHPEASPCDLHIDKKFSWNYSPLPQGDFPRELQPAPRFDLPIYVKRDCGMAGQKLQERLDEYEALYQQQPSPFWWGWAFFRKSSPYGTWQILWHVANSASLARGKFRTSATASVTREGSNVVKKAKVYQEYKLNAREVCVLTRLQHFQWAPKLLKSTKDTITMSNVGQPVTKDTLPPDYATQFRKILTDMESVGVQHNDIIFPCSTTSFRKHEVMVHEGRLSLIDFNWATIDRGVPCNVSTRLFTPGWTPCKDLTMMSVLDGMALEPALPWNQILRAMRSSKLNLRG